MDLVGTLKGRLDSLPEGPYVPGLRSVLLHIESAFGHLNRGQSTSDETAFTDVIYRTNQAFEGSVKEAYRVLAGKNPDKKKPYEIEQYLESKGVFRSRVLSQFTTYRTEWRNPSTHDYKLSFDESEAFLAIVSVSAFACLVLAQISQKIAYDEARRDAEEIEPASPHSSATGPERVLQLLEQSMLSFLGYASSSSPRPEFHSEAQFVGALAGYLSAVLPEATFDVEPRFEGTREMPDLIASLADAKIVVEVKRMRKVSSSAISSGLGQIERYMEIGGIGLGVLLAFEPDVFEYMSSRMYLPRSGKPVIVVHPVGVL